MAAPGVRSHCPVCGPYVVDVASSKEVMPGVAQVQIPMDFAATHNAGETHIYLTEIKRAYREATRWTQVA